MLRMMQCPHCGVENSAKRVACFQCQGDLSPVVEAPRTQVPAAAARPQQERTGPRAAPAPQRPLEARASRPPSTPWTEESGMLEWLFFPNSSRKARLFRQIEQQLRAGISIGEAFDYLGQGGDSRFQNHCQRIGRELFAGGTLTDAARPYHDLFAQEDLGLIRVGELSGNLAGVFGQMAQRLEQMIELRWGFVISHWHLFVIWLPSVLTGIPLVMAANDVFGVGILHMKETNYDEIIAALTTAFFRRAAMTTVPIVGGLIIVLLAWRMIGGTREGQQFQHRLLVSLPLVGGAFRRAAIGRFIGNLSALWGGGAPPSMAVEAAAEASGSRTLEARVKAVVPQLQGGASLGDSLASTGLFDGETLSVIRTGERSGDLPASLERLARDFHLHARLGLRRLPMISYLFIWGILALGMFWVMYTIVNVWYIKLPGELWNPEPFGG